MSTLETLVRVSAQRRPTAPAVREPGGGELSYGALDALANRIAHGLAELGVRRGDRVALWLPKSAAAVAAMQGVLRLGAAYVPIDPLSPALRAAALMDDCDVVATVAERAAGGAVLARRDGAAEIAWSELARLDCAPPARVGPSAPDELAYILYTSGSTGRPKGVCVSHRAALAFVRWAAAELAVAEGERIANHAPLHFDLSVFDLYAAFLGGATVTLVDARTAFAPRELVALVRDERIAIWYSVPAALILMIDRGGLLAAELPALRAVLFAGEPLPIKYVRALRDRFGQLRLLNLYGPTETNVCTFHEVGAVAADRERPVPIGRACSGDTVRAVDDEGDEVAVGACGELVVAGASVMLGYWGREPLSGAPYRTGDVVRRISDAEYEFVGRRDGMVKIRGHRVEVGEIEACLVARPDVEQAAVALEGEGVAAQLVAYLVAVDGRAPSLLDVKRHCAARLPRYMIVDRVRSVAALPRTSTGKLDRRRLALELA